MSESEMKDAVGRINLPHAKLDGYLERLLGPGEHGVHIARQHWLVLLSEILVEMTLTIVILVLVIILWFVSEKNNLVLLGLIVLLLPLLSMVWDILTWRNRKYVITNRRVIQVSGVINKNITDSSLDKVNDVKMDQSFFGRLLGYGDVTILTASELGANTFKRIGNPIHFKTSMLAAKESLERQRSAEGALAEKEVSDTDVPALITQLDNLRKQGLLTEEEFKQKKAELLKKI